jgi:hypothetical protein
MKRIGLKVGVVLVAAMFIASALQCHGVAGSPMQASAPREAWWDARWHYRAFVTVNATGHDRNNYPVELPVNFAGHLNGKLDNNSIRLVFEGVEMVSQYNPGNRTGGLLIFVTNATSGSLMNFTVYYDTEENGLKPVTDYGDPDYVTDYKDLIEKGKLLGSSPFNGTTDSWWFPPGMGFGNYQRQNWVVGDVKAIMTAWGDGREDEFSPWIRHYARVALYRDSFNSLVSVWNNASETEVVWASGLANISTGRPLGIDDASKDHGLHVITDDWTVNDVSDLDYAGIGTTMASATVDTYNRELAKTCSFLTDGSTAEYLIDPLTDSVIAILSVTGSITGLYAPAAYSIDEMSGDSSILFSSAPVVETIEVNYTVKAYDQGDMLNVVSKSTPLGTNYLIMYDSDDPAGVAYARPQIGAIIFPTQVPSPVVKNMVVEFWENVTAPGPGAILDYYVNVTTNAKEWWYNTTLTPAQNHLAQANDFDFIFSYMNGSSNPKQQTIDTMDSYNHPTINKVRGWEAAVPVDVTVTAPYTGQMFNGWMDLPGDPMDTTVTITAAATGDTLYRFYYTVADGPEVDFTGSASVPVPSINGDVMDGRLFIKVVAMDTNGTKITKHVMIYVPKTFWQHITSSVGSIFVIMLVMIGGFMGICGMAAIKKKRAGPVAAPNI